MQQDWHYKDEVSGKRTGPVSEEEVTRLIADGRLQRATVVWNPQMSEWAKASTTDLASMFGASPPPLPAAEISRWALFAVALFPVWGTTVQVAISSAFPNPQEVFDNWAWILLFIAGNGLLGWLDERSLERAGLQLKGATVISALLIPAYIYLSCKTYRRHSDVKPWFAYAPLIIWTLAILLAVNEQSYVFGR